MALEDQIDSDLTAILTTHGVSATLYRDPTHTPNDEGTTTITKGTGTSVTILIFNTRGELWTPQMEGIDREQVLTCYADNAYTIDKKDIILWNTVYYKINSIDSNPLGTSTVTFYRLEIERIQPQSAVS